MELEHSAVREPYSASAFGEAMLRCRRSGTTDPALLALAEAIFGVQTALLGQALEKPPADCGAPLVHWLTRAMPVVAGAVAAHSPAAPQGLVDIGVRLSASDEKTLDRAVRGDARALQELSGQCGVDASVLLFVLRAAMQPYYVMVFPPSETAAVPYPPRRTCPACGGRPLMARHADPDGNRFLHCSVCGREWAYPRMACCSCGETDHRQLETMYVPEDEGHRVYLCAACRRYTKAVDERLLGGRAYPPLEDMITLHLDELARERGYTSVADQGHAREDAGRKRFH
jgi:formate dehydrogenase accessory protein FdhE